MCMGWVMLGTSAALTSLKVFRRHIQRREDGTLDVSGVISRECYLEWLDAKLARECDEEAHKFHRTITNHIAGVDGRTPFEEDEEAALLILFRLRKSWPCFPPHLATMGRRYRGKGYHEKIYLGEQTQVLQDLLFAKHQEEMPRGAMMLPIPLKMSIPASRMQRELSAMELNDIFSRMRLREDAIYANNLANNVVLNYASPHFSIEDWHQVNQLLRFVVLAKTRKLTAEPLSLAQLRIAAHALCRMFDSVNTVSMVFDMTARQFHERCLAQNEYSLQVIGCMLGNNFARGVDGTELYSVILAVCAAFLTPGVSFCIRKQKHWCVNNDVKAFDLHYYVDPQTFLCVAYGRLSEEKNGV